MLKIKRAERTVTVCLDGTLSAEWEQTSRDLEMAVREYHTLKRVETGRAVQDGRLNGAKAPAATRLDELAGKVEALTLQAREVSQAYQDACVVFRLRALPRLEWEELVEEHPPASGDERGLPFDPDKIAEAALHRAGTIVSVTHPDGTAEDFSHEDWAEFSSELSEAQHADFRSVVVQMNAGSNDVPFLPASAETRDSETS